MPRYFITLAYNGQNYVGWQIQPNGISVQQTIEQALATILRQQTPITAAGRTDAGVHARKMIAHIDLPTHINTHQLIARLNAILPKDIAVSDIQHVAPHAHARFSATARTYQYHLTTAKDPFLHPYKWKINFQPDIHAMNALCPVLKEYTDFTSFSKLHTDTKTNICHIHHAQWTQHGNGTDFTFTITADRFLRNMVRAIVGTLLQAGRGRLSEAAFRQIIEARNRCQAGQSVPAHALFLCHVDYPAEIINS